MNYLKIQPIQVGELKQFTVNAIVWNINNLQRGATEATAHCSLIFVLPNDNGTSQIPIYFDVEIDNETLQSWGSDDGVIDDKIIAYSPLFVKEI